MKTNKSTDGLSTFDMAEYLDTKEDVAEYLNQVLADNEDGELAEAIGCIAKARGIAEIAKASGLTREELYKDLMEDSQPSLDTIQRICKALGLKLGVVPA